MLIVFCFFFCFFDNNLFVPESVLPNIFVYSCTHVLIYPYIYICNEMA